MPVAGASLSGTKRPVRRLTRSALLMVGLLLGASPAKAGEAMQLIDLINDYRAYPEVCDGRRAEPREPLAADRRLAFGVVESDAQLQRALRAAGYPQADVQVISVSGPPSPRAAMAALQSRYCGLLLSRQYADIGVSYYRGIWQVALGRSQLAKRLAGWEQAGQEILQQVNQARARPRVCGRQRFAAAPPLAWSPRLAKAALAHSRDMASRNYFSHQGRDGSQVGSRARREGYNWYGIGENIAAGQSTARQAVSSWLASPGHCANIMNPTFREMGAAYAENDRSRASIYWTQVFGKPR